MAYFNNFASIDYDFDGTGINRTIKKSEKWNGFDQCENNGAIL